MDMPKLNSQYPNVHDNTEKELIFVSPAVLDNKLRDFENYGMVKADIKGDIVLAVTLFIAVFTVAEFTNPLPPIITGATLRGAFVTALLFMIVKILFAFHKIKVSNRGARTRKEIIDVLLGESIENQKMQRSKDTLSTKKSGDKIKR